MFLLLQTRLNGLGRRGLKFEDSKDKVEFISASTTSSSSNLKDSAPTTPTSKRQRRTSIPPRPRISLNLWGVLKNCIGRELSRIPLPVGKDYIVSFIPMTFKSVYSIVLLLPLCNALIRKQCYLLACN